MAPRVIVVGGGCENSSCSCPKTPYADFSPVSGLSAAHTIYLAGGNVLLLDKNSPSVRWITQGAPG